MRIIVPMAGRGTRLRPHTLTTPKPLIKIAGKPIVQRLVEDIARICQEPIEEVAYVTGRFGEQAERELVEVAERLGAKGSIHYQDTPLGTAHAILCAADALRGDVVVAFADTLFRGDFNIPKNRDGVIWTKQVDNPKAFGVVKYNQDGVITDFVEKPETFVSDLAIIGIYWFKDGENLRKELQYLIDNHVVEKGEYQLTTALENMKNKGLQLIPGQVTAWMDCGNKDVTIETNGRILEFVAGEETLVHPTARLVNSTLTGPCFIGEGAVVEDAHLGPNVSLGAGSVVRRSNLQQCLVAERVQLEDVRLRNSMLGDHVQVVGPLEGELSLGDYSTVKA
jgi:glucose-1-phosphate thymidylyltransferase